MTIKKDEIYICSRHKNCTKWNIQLDQCRCISGPFSKKADDQMYGFKYCNIKFGVKFEHLSKTRRDFVLDCERGHRADSLSCFRGHSFRLIPYKGE